jgi:hypothetical protein
MNGKRLPALLGLALLPAQAATHDPGTSSVADTASDTTIGTAYSRTSGTMSDRMRIPTLDPVDEESQESEESGQQESTTPEEISQGESSTDESISGQPMQQQSLRGDSEPPRMEPRHHWSNQGE